MIASVKMYLLFLVLLVAHDMQGCLGVPLQRPTGSSGVDLDKFFRCSIHRLNMAFETPRPVCGSNGKTYGTRTELREHNCLTGGQVTVKYDGPCLTLGKGLPGVASLGGRP